MNTSIVVLSGIVIVVATIAILVTARREADPLQERATARYLGAVTMLSTFVVLFAGYAVVAQLTRFIVPERYRFGDGPGILDIAGESLSGSRPAFFDRANDEIWRSAVLAFVILVAGAVILAFHRRQTAAMVRDGRLASTSATRVEATFRYAVCFVAAFVVLMALAFGLYGVFRIAAPGVATSGSGNGERSQGIAQLVSLMLLGGGAALLFRMHWPHRAVSPAGTGAEPPLASVE